MVKYNKENRIYSGGYDAIKADIFCIGLTLLKMVVGKDLRDPM